jgi:hypothetical protein
MFPYIAICYSVAVTAKWSSLHFQILNATMWTPLCGSVLWGSGIFEALRTTVQSSMSTWCSPMRRCVSYVPHHYNLFFYKAAVRYMSEKCMYKTNTGEHTILLMVADNSRWVGTIPGVRFERPLRLPLWHNLQRVRKETPFLVADLEVCPAPLPVMASGGDRGKRPRGGGSSHDGRQPPSCRARMDAAPGQASSLARWCFTLHWRFCGPTSYRNVV